MKFLNRRIKMGAIQSTFFQIIFILTMNIWITCQCYFNISLFSAAQHVQISALIWEETDCLASKMWGRKHVTYMCKWGLGISSLMLNWCLFGCQLYDAGGLYKLLPWAPRENWWRTKRQRKDLTGSPYQIWEICVYTYTASQMLLPP